ncbi:DNA-binding protein [Herbaspirillum lusitanum]|uniref:DNA-binding protein n=1 Tax=Herbaspirillum lusitanum TaxID=213312 RepID=UPI002AA2A370|nr:DNA-binding protein [Herbaspirillum lusitanum]
MNNLTDNESRAHTRMLTTNELAFKLAMEPQSIRKRWSQTGSYFSIRPLKLPNGKLRWPANAIDMLFNINCVA